MVEHMQEGTNVRLVLALLSLADGPIKNETPKTAVGDRGTESRFRGQIPHTETKPYPQNAAVPRGFERGSHVSLERRDWLAGRRIRTPEYRRKISL